MKSVYFRWRQKLNFSLSSCCRWEVYTGGKLYWDEWVIVTQLSTYSTRIFVVVLCTFLLKIIKGFCLPYVIWLATNSKLRMNGSLTILNWENNWLCRFVFRTLLNIWHGAFCKNSKRPLTICAKQSMLDIWRSSKYTSATCYLFGFFYLSLPAVLLYTEIV